MTAASTYRPPQSLLVDLETLQSVLAAGDDPGPVLARIVNELIDLPATNGPAVEQAVRRRIRMADHWDKRSLESVVRHDPRGRLRHRLQALFARRTVVPLRASAGLEYVFVHHWNGYLREESVRRLSRGPWTPFVFAMIARRLNDWTPQVRAAAGEAMQVALRDAPADVVATAAAALLGITATWGHWAQQERESLLQLFDRADVRQRLAERLRDAVDGPAAATLRILLVRPEFDEALPMLATEARMPSVRAIASEALLAGAFRWFDGQLLREKGYHGHPVWRRVFATRPLTHAETFEAALARAFGDRAVVVRRLGMDAAIRNWRTMSPAMLDELLTRIANDRDHGVQQRLEYLQKKRLEEAVRP